LEFWKVLITSTAVDARSDERNTTTTTTTTTARTRVNTTTTGTGLDKHRGPGHHQATIKSHTLITHAVKLQIRRVVDGGFSVKQSFWLPSTTRTFNWIVFAVDPGPSQPATGGRTGHVLDWRETLVELEAVTGIFICK
jgi:hypothetical protein